MKLGAHISTAKPFSDAIIRGREVGCEAIQIFANPPQRWNPVLINPEEIERFKKLNTENGQMPVLIHSIYLVNFASENSYFYSQSIASLIDDMKKAQKIGALGVNTHLGSTKGKDLKECMPKVVEAITEILAETQGDDTFFIIENAAGAGNIIGDTLEEIAQITEAVKSKRVKVLIDTAHAFESGYKFDDISEIEKFLNKFEELIGLDKLIGFHLNDSKTALSSHRDRHADIGKGLIGLEIFRYLVNHPKLKDKIGILETPQDEISWSEQLEMLRSQ